jgi:LAO/AO transport system kinase
MEIADIFVVNKGDREGVDRAVASIETMLGLQTYGASDWRPPVLKTTATSGAGVVDVLAAIDGFRAHQTTGQGPSGRTGLVARRHARAAHRLRELLAQRFLQAVEARVLTPGELDALVARVAAQELDPYSAADLVLRRALRTEPTP